MFRLCSVSAILVVLAAISFSLPAQEKLRLQPELDAIDVENYLKNERLFKLQIDCIVYDGPCDAVGHFLKPRVPSALLGECPFCTPKQAKDINKVLVFIQDNKPELYRILFEKFIKDQGISIPASNGKDNSTSPTKDS